MDYTERTFWKVNWIFKQNTCVYRYPNRWLWGSASSVLLWRHERNRSLHQEPRTVTWQLKNMLMRFVCREASIAVAGYGYRSWHTQLITNEILLVITVIPDNQIFNPSHFIKCCVLSEECVHQTGNVLRSVVQERTLKDTLPIRTCGDTHISFSFFYHYSIMIISLKNDIDIIPFVLVYLTARSW